MESCTLEIKVVPRASSNRVVLAEGEGGLWQVRITAPAVDGKANSAVQDFLADLLQIKKRQIRIKLGDKSRHKILLIEGLDRQEVDLRLKKASG